MTTDSTSGPAPVRPGGTAGVSGSGGAARDSGGAAAGSGLTRPASPGRLVGVDVARGLALVGMMAVHVIPDFDAQHRVTVAYAVAAGRASALFAVLAGVGIGLLLAARSRWPVGAVRAPGELPPGAVPPARGTTFPHIPNDVLVATRRGLLRRAAMLLVLGLLLGSLASPPIVILASYAVMFVLVLPFLGLPTSRLAALTAGWLTVVPVLAFALRTVVPDSPIVDPGITDLAHPWALTRELVLTGSYPALVWAGYLLVGLLLTRLPLGRPAVQLWLVGTGLAVAVGARLVSALLLAATGGTTTLPGGPPLPRPVPEVLAAGALGTTPTTDWRWLLVAAPHTATPFDLLTTTGSSIAVLGACLWLTTTRAIWLLRPFAALGAMTLSLYSLHVAALDVTLPWSGYSGAGLWLTHVLAALALATLWTSLVGRGPLELLSHRLTWPR